MPLATPHAPQHAPPRGAHAGGRLKARPLRGRWTCHHHAAPAYGGLGVCTGGITRLGEEHQVVVKP